MSGAASSGRSRRFEDLVTLLKEIEHLRTERSESERRVRKEIRGFLAELVEVLDACESQLASLEARAAEAGEPPPEASYLRGMRRRLARALERFGLTRIQAADGKALPGFHTIEETRPEPGLEDDAILEERVPGYLWRGEVVRKALVTAVRNA